MPGSVQLLDINREPTNRIEDACLIQHGIWFCPYTLQILRYPEDISVEHVVSLPSVRTFGWSSTQQTRFANDILNLVVVSREAGRNERPITEWQPRNSAYRCVFAKHYIVVMAEYNLTISVNEKQALLEMLNSCI
jgi:hypothetical protein